ncbi:hypothetical protein [Pedobacter sp. N23S346]|uniref:hypothetical protein n=1 Tax=Pedobacter sp. N23S346 TaxID=3402750 RepID=UPI003ACD92F2
MESKAIPLPYWYRLLDNWVCVQDNSGLSIPFLVGAKSISTDGVYPNENSIKDLFCSFIAETQPNYCVTLKYCNTIEAYILGLQLRSDVIEPYFKSSYSEIPALALIDNVFGRVQSLDEIVNFLEKEYNSYILSGKYSRQNSAFGVWGSFSDADVNFIKNARS